MNRRWGEGCMKISYARSLISVFQRTPNGGHFQVDRKPLSMSGSRASSARHRSHDKVEKTLALIKPEAVKHAEDIENIILENGFEILAKREVRLTPEDVVELYDEHSGQPYFQNLIDHLSNNLMIALCISKLNGISEWNRLMGPSNVLEARVYWPSSIRAIYGMCDYDEYINSEYINGVHGSQDYGTSVKEINFFFPEFTQDPAKGHQVNEYLQIAINPILTEGLNELCKEKPTDPVVWLADWLLTHNPNTLDFPDNEESFLGKESRPVSAISNSLVS